VRIPRAPRDLVLLSGPEPAFRWRSFSRTVVDLAEALGVQIAVCLGALLADVPHSRPVSVTAHASDPGLVERLALTPPTYEGPTGIVGVLHQAFTDAGLPAASLWAAVPHYVAVAPNPKGALALLRRLESLVGVTVDATDLEDAATEYESQVSRAVELIQVPVGDRQERGRVGRLRLGDRADLELELVAEALDAARDAHEVALLEAAGEHVGVAERAAGDRSRAVAELEREVGRARPCGQAVLARAGEHGVDVVSGTQGGDRGLGRGGHREDGPS
jgi:hypothetical protein